MRALRIALLAALVSGTAACAATGENLPLSAPRTPGAPDGGRERFTREFDAGLARFDARDYAGAEARFERALRVDPYSADGWNALARVAYERGRIRLCIERADVALREDPDHREARLNRGLALFTEPEYGAALAEFRRILSYPVDDGKIADYSLAYREWESRSESGHIEVPFPEAVSRGLLNVDREAMLARWYARLTAVLVAGPGFPRKFVCETDHYRVVTDDSDDLARLVAERLELILVSYAELLPPPGPEALAERFSVTVFSRREDYVRYLSDILGDRATANISGGSYHPLLRELLLAKGAVEERTLLVLQHEGFHQYAYALVPRVPAWFGEGLADYFAPSRLANGRLVVGGVHPLRLTALEKALAGTDPPDLRSLMLAEPAVFMAARETDLERRSTTVGRNYALAWALAHFLVDGESGARRAIIHDYFRALEAGGSRMEAFERAFGEVDLDELTDAFDAHCRRVLLAPAR